RNPCRSPARRQRAAGPAASTSGRPPAAGRSSARHRSAAPGSPTPGRVPRVRRTPRAAPPRARRGRARRRLPRAAPPAARRDLAPWCLPTMSPVALNVQRERLAPETFRLPVEKIRDGYYTDAYFNFTRELLEAEELAPHVVL